MNVLFVDDEANVLSGLRRMLRSKRNSWNMDFVGSGAEALALMEQKKTDVIVTDMRMPSMNGAELLAHVLKTHPNTVRLVLSGQSEQEKILRSIGPAHQFMSKPCDPELLISTIDRACSLQNHLQDPSLRTIVNQVSFLPSLPGIYQRLVSELDSDKSSLEQIGEIISEDIAMTAKILQLVNSSFFGLAMHVTCPTHAVALLGINVIRPVVLLAGAISQCNVANIAGYSLSESISHCLRVATLAKEIADAEGLSAHAVEDSYIAGMMHDIGKLIFAVSLQDVFQQTIQEAKENRVPSWEVELQRLGTTHAEVGAYLLSLWGFPNTIVEAVAFHHRPGLAGHNQFSPVSAVHIANTLVEQASNPNHSLTRLQNYLQSINLESPQNKLDAWKKLLQIKLRASSNSM